MKKLLLVGAIALFGAMNAQTGFKLGAHVGLPVGDIKDLSSVNLGVDGSYMWPASAEFNLGIATGYSAFVGKDYTTTIPGIGSYTVKAETLSLVPIAAAAQYKISPMFSLGVDLGYGFLFGGGSSDGGFYFQPKAAYHFGLSEVNLGYMGVSKNGSTIISINLGYAYCFGK